MGPLMVDLQGKTLSQEEHEYLAHPLIGGVILFSRNYASVDQITHLTKTLHNIKQGQLLVAVDHEGGRVQRFRDGFTVLPPAGAFGTQYDNDRDHACHLAKQCGWLLAAELRSTGIDFSFAPVLDIDHGISQVIGNRAFHSNADAIATLASSFIEGIHSAGMAVVGKHFPGHGGVTQDSHKELPTDDRSQQTIFEQDLIPYVKLIGKGLDAVMPAHVVYSSIDTHLAGFSKFWLQQILRRQLNFNGVIFSDDLSMAAAASVGNYCQRVESALSAGCDMALICNNPAGVTEVLDNYQCNPSNQSNSRLSNMLATSKVATDIRMDSRWQAATLAISTLFG